MISIPRSLVRQLRAVFHRAGIRKSAASPEPLVSIEGLDGGLRIQAMSNNSAVSYFQQGTFEPERFALPLEALAVFEGRSHDRVQLETQGKNRLLARWTDKGVPQIVQLETTTAKDLPEFPAFRQAWSKSGPELLKALADAGQVAARESTRYVLEMLQLRGEQGEIVATDGRHILRRSASSFPGPSTC